MVFSNGRIRPSYRHSVLDLDVTLATDTSQPSPNSSVGSIQSTSSSRLSTRSPRIDKIGYNSNILHKIKQSGLRITPEEVYQLRRELQEDFSNQKGREAKRNFLLNALDVLSELRQELRDEVETSKSTEDRSSTEDILESPDLQFFVFEYQALICWIYSEIRFAPYMSEMQRHFNRLKKEHALLLEALPPRSEPFLLCALRFSHLCLEYAPYCDDEALRWVKIAAERGTGRRKVVNLTIGSVSSINSNLSQESTDISRREDDYKNQLLRDLKIIIKQIEGAIEMENLRSCQENKVD